MIMAIFETTLTSEAYTRIVPSAHGESFINNRAGACDIAITASLNKPVTSNGPPIVYVLNGGSHITLPATGGISYWGLVIPNVRGNIAGGEVIAIAEASPPTVLFQPRSAVAPAGTPFRFEIVTANSEVNSWYYNGTYTNTGNSVIFNAPPVVGDVAEVWCILEANDRLTYSDVVTLTAS